MSLANTLTELATNLRLYGARFAWIMDWQSGSGESSPLVPVVHIIDTIAIIAIIAIAAIAAAFISTTIIAASAVDARLQMDEEQVLDAALECIGCLRVREAQQCLHLIHNQPELYQHVCHRFEMLIPLAVTVHVVEHILGGCHQKCSSRRQQLGSGGRCRHPRRCRRRRYRGRHRGGHLVYIFLNEIVKWNHVMSVELCFTSLAYFSSLVERAAMVAFKRCVVVEWSVLSKIWRRPVVRSKVAKLGFIGPVILAGRRFSHSGRRLWPERAQRRPRTWERDLQDGAIAELGAHRATVTTAPNLAKT